MTATLPTSVEQGPVTTPSAPRAAFVATGVLTAVLVLWTGGFFSSAAPLVGALVAVAWWSTRHRELSGPEVLLVATTGAFVTYWCLAAFVWGTGPSGAYGLAASSCCLASGVLAGRSLESRQADTLESWVAWSTVAVALAALLALVLRVEPWASTAQGLWRAAGPLTYPNAFGVLLTIGLFVVLAAASLTEPQRGFGLTVVLVAIGATISRGAIIALVVGVVLLPSASRQRLRRPAALAALGCLPLFATAGDQELPPVVLVGIAALALATIWDRWLPRRPSRRRALVGALVVLLLAGTWALGAGLGAGLVDTAATRIGPGSVDTRSPEWSRALDQFTDMPVFGAGPERPIVVDDPGRATYSTRYAHSEPLQVLAGGGLLAGALALGVASAFRRLVAVARWPHARAAAGVVVVAGMLDFSWHFPAIAAVVGLAVTLPGTPPVRTGDGGWWRRPRLPSIRTWGRRRKVAGVLALVALGWALVVPTAQILALRDGFPTSTAFSRHDGVDHIPPVDLEATSSWLVLALIAAEDRRFGQHHGIDGSAFTKALRRDLLGQEAPGGSTITQQLAKNLWLSPDRSWVRKTREAWLALLADGLLSKERILELYVNVVDWGQGTYGLCAASWRFFDKPPYSITREDAALLVTALPDPDDRDPSDPSDVQLERRDQILWTLHNVADYESGSALDQLDLSLDSPATASTPCSTRPESLDR